MSAAVLIKKIIHLFVTCNANKSVCKPVVTWEKCTCTAVDGTVIICRYLHWWLENTPYTGYKQAEYGINFCP